MDAAGKFVARTDGAVIGFLAMSIRAPDAADVRVVTRKTWTTWNAKYALCVKSSAVRIEGAPAWAARPG